MSNELLHYGIPGMHWGIRRAHVTSGHLTKAKEVTDAGSKITEEGLKIHKTVSGMRSNRRREDLSQMSDEELKRRINRMNMEQQYYKLSDGHISKGEAYTKDTLEIAGSALAIGSSALGIALAVKNLKGA